MSEIQALSAEEQQTLRDFLNLGRALIQSLTPAQVAESAAALGEILPLLQSLGTPETTGLVRTLTGSAGALGELLELVVLYHKSGTIRKAFELTGLAGVVRDALSSEAVIHAAGTLNEALVAVDHVSASLGGLDKLKTLANAAAEAGRAAAGDPEPVGLWGLMQALKDPGVQKGLKFMIHFARAIGQK